jgi:hypothetical protein
MRLLIAGLVAFLLGIPFTDEAQAGVWDVVSSSLDLGFSIADLAGNS